MTLCTKFVLKEVNMETYWTFINKDNSEDGIQLDNAQIIFWTMSEGASGEENGMAANFDEFINGKHKNLQKFVIEKFGEKVLQNIFYAIEKIQNPIWEIKDENAIIVLITMFDRNIEITFFDSEKDNPYNMPCAQFVVDEDILENLTSLVSKPVVDEIYAIADLLRLGTEIDFK
jgi:hypothetical protein